MANHTDPAHRATENLIKQMESELAKEYRQAYREVSEKYEDYLKRFKTKDRIWAGWVADGSKTEEQYRQWRMGQLAVGERWSEMKQTLAEDLHHANEIARSTVNGYMPEVYAINHNYGTYEAEHGSGVDTSYTLYDRQTVERIWRDHPELMPGYAPNSAVARNIAAGKDVAWNRQQIQSCMVQGILQGESIDKMATRLQGVTTADYKAAVRYARTMSTSCQNAGRYDAYRRATDMGIDLTLVWAATLDERTRISHRELDSEEREVDEPFNVDGVDIYYPGDLGGEDYKVPGYLIWNCRCTIIAQVKGFEYKIHGKDTDYSQIDGDYEDWLDAHESTSNPIDLPRQKSEAIRDSYIRQYRGFPLRNTVDNSDQNGYYRRDNSTPASGYTEPMKKRHVKAVMSEMGVDYGKAKISLDRNPDLIGRGFMAHTDQEGKNVTFYSDAFVSREQLVKSIGHEKVHLDQIKKRGIVETMEELNVREKEARESEEKWWNDYKAKTGYESE